MKFVPHPYQQKCIQAILTKPGVALWLEMGLGKTVTTLTALELLMFDFCTVRKALVIAPKKVAEATWQDEAAKWEHTKKLKISTILGTEKQRTAAAEAEADLYITNRDNVVWLVNHFGRRWPFDCVVLDEASSFKTHSTARFKALRRVRPQIDRVIELTGTPAAQGLLGLWAQAYLLDGGQRLGKRFTDYRLRYFKPDKRNGMQIYSWKPAPDSQEQIENALSDIVVCLKAADYLTLPELTVHDIPVALDKTAAQQYREFEQQSLLEVEGETITALQAAALTNKLLQLCNGQLYDASGQAHELNECKLESLSELIEALDGQKCLVFYAFRFDEESILRELKRAHRGLRARVLRGADDAAAWNRGEVDVLLAHPASCAYGLNLQAGGHNIVWYSLPWSTELYQQANGRLYRQGQQQPVIVHRLLVKGGADELVARSLQNNANSQELLMRALTEKIKEAKANCISAHSGD